RALNRTMFGRCRESRATAERAALRLARDTRTRCCLLGPSWVSSSPEPRAYAHAQRVGPPTTMVHVSTVEKVLLAAPRGYCAGVDRAVETVERALKAFGAPIYVRKQIVHNLPVVRDLESKGAIFVEELDEVPSGATAILSAHGVAPEVYAQARARELRVIDATCPLVTKVHNEAKKFALDGYH